MSDDIRIFLGSPGDVDAEREIAYRVIKDVDDIRQIIKDYRPDILIPSLRAIGWEQVPRGIGLPNEIIIDRLPIEESDIFIFILWKRFGTPTGTRRKNGSKYISGTQEEFEKAYECLSRNKSTRPIIMVYRKIDDFSIASLNNKDLEQYKRVRKFFEDCESGGKHPALTQSFLAKDFERLLRKNLLDTILKLTASKSGSSETNNKQEVSSHVEISQESGKEENSVMTDWLSRNNFSANPFKYYVAEDEKDLIKYYVPFQGLSLISNEIVSGKKNWLFFGVEGIGKTALKHFIASRCSPIRASKTLAIHYETSDFLEALSRSSSVDEIQLYTAHQIYNSALTAMDAPKNYGLDIRSLNEPAMVFLKLGKLLEELQGYERAVCLLELASGISEISLSKFIDVVGHLITLPADKVGFRIFLPKNLQARFLRQGKYLGKCDWREIQWEDKELKELIKRRMIYYSVNKLNPNQALGTLYESKGKTGPLDDEIVKLSDGNPRAVMWLANRFFLEHCQNDPVPLKIESRAWDKVQLDWWTTGKNLILGPTGSTESFFATGSDVFFDNKPLKLSKRSKALLKRLVDAGGQTCSKEELIRAGWPNVDSAGVTVAALREAMRRLKGELKDKNHIDPAWLETQHDQGYRLLEPASVNEEEN